MPEGGKCPWYKSLTSYDDDGNEHLGETDVAVGGVAVSTYQLEDSAADADPADPATPGQDFSQRTRDFACLADLDRAANGLTNKRERDIFRAHYIRGKTLKAIASKYGIGPQWVSKIARAARDKILTMDFVIENINLRATLPQPRRSCDSRDCDIAHVEWIDDLRRHNDVELIRTRGRYACIWEPLPRCICRHCTKKRDGRLASSKGVLPLATANRNALWRLAELEREDINWSWWNWYLIASLKVSDKKTRWRKRKSDVSGLWDLLTEFYHPPEEDADHWRGIPVYSVTQPRLGPVIPALWTTRSTYPARIHVAAPPPSKPQWVRSSGCEFWPDLVTRKRNMEPSKELLKARPRPPHYAAGYRALWKKKLEPDDWRIKYQRERQEEFLLSTEPQQKEAA
jgi:hypothetical protein